MQMPSPNNPLWPDGNGVPYILAQLPAEWTPTAVLDANFQFLVELFMNSPSQFLILLTLVCNQLPKTLPATPGVLWNNGGAICLS